VGRSVPRRGVRQSVRKVKKSKRWAAGCPE
jgi:hypothetical protein